MELAGFGNAECFALTDKGRFEAGLEISRFKGGYILRASFTNNTKDNLRLTSIVVADMVLGIEADEILEHGYLQKSQSRFYGPGHITKKNRGFMELNQNKFSFMEGYGYLKSSIVSEWFTIIRKHGSSVMIGALTTGLAFSAIYARKEKNSLRIRIACQMDEKIIRPKEIVRSEEVFFAEGRETEVAEQFAQGISEKMRVKYNPKKITAVCTPYYWNGNHVDEKIVISQLDAIKKRGINVGYVQIDAGYCRHWGDWLDSSHEFPHKMSWIVKKIKEHSMSAGIWISPFVASPESKIFRNHPDWFVRTENNRFLEGRSATPFDSIIPGLSLKVIDMTNEDATNHLIGILKKFKEDGFTLFKFDFMYPHFIYQNRKGITRIQAFRRVFEKFKKVLEGSYIMTAISPLSPLVGLADSVRVGIDTSFPDLSLPLLKDALNNYMLAADLENADIRHFLNKKIWSNDVDCLLLRRRYGLSEKLIGLHKDWIMKNDTSLWLGDDICKLDKKQESELKVLVKKFSQEKD